MNTPEPCDKCWWLYSDCMCEDDPNYSAECSLGQELGHNDCVGFVEDSRNNFNIPKESKEQQYKKALETLLYSLGWAIIKDREGSISPAELLILRSKIKETYILLGHTVEELKGYVIE